MLPIEQPKQLDLLTYFELQRLEVHPIAVQADGCPRALLERLGEILDERAAVRMGAKVESGV